jgi:transposase
MAVRNGKTEKAPVLVRVQKFQIKPTLEQLATLQRVSDNLFQVWNDCLEQRQLYFNERIKPLYEELKSADIEAVTEIKSRIKRVYAEAPVYHATGAPHRSQASWLTKMRQSSSDFAAVPCGWQQECLKILEGSFASFAQLRNKGDTTARPPRLKVANSFCEIQGCVGFQFSTKTLAINPQKPLGEVHQLAMRNTEEMHVVLSPGKPLPGGTELRFSVPEYQRLILSQAVKLNKFTLYRDKKKRFWISIAYSIPQPKQAELVPEEVVFVALGASYIGVVSSHGEETIDLWRSDHFWMPKINALRERLKPVTGGSKAWRRRKKAMDRMYEIMRLQQLQNQREVIARKLHQHGAHFIVLEHSPIRGKEGKLADKSRAERSGEGGLNWSAQNTGSLARLKQLLEQKTAEWGGSVSALRLEDYPIGTARERKVPAAKAARKQYLKAA